MSAEEMFEILRKAEAIGWVDPGHTEMLEDTVRRAQEFLATAP